MTLARDLRPLEGVARGLAALIIESRDRTAWGELYRLTGPALLERFRRILDPEEAKDALNAFFIRLPGKLGGWTREAPFMPWLVRCATNEALNQYSYLRRRTHGRLCFHESSHSTALGPGPSIEATVIARESLESVRAELDPMYLAALQVDLTGHSIESGAAALELNAATYATRLRRARLKARHLVEQG